MSVHDLMDRVRNELALFKFLATDERQFQEQVVRALSQRGVVCDREVAVPGSRYDISVRDYDAHLVLELKVKGSPSEVERQAQRYAMHADVDGVMIVTTSQRLARSITRGTMPGMARQPQPGEGMLRKPFEAVSVRTM